VLRNWFAVGISKLKHSTLQMEAAPTTAQRLKLRLAHQNVSGADIKPSHLAHVYKRMTTIGSEADFSAIKPILDALPKADVTACDVSGVIVETRCHKNVAAVVSSYMSAVDMPVQFFHGRQNGDFVKQEIPQAFHDRITFIELPIDALSANLYNALLLSPPFWDSLHSRKNILVFQTDSILCENSTRSISDFTSFDYIAAPWNRQRLTGIVADGGCGGLSLRSWDVSVECLRRFPADDWVGGEDGYFAFHIEIMGGKVAGAAWCEKFATQIRFKANSWGVHKPENLKGAELEAFLAYCPEARILF